MATTAQRVPQPQNIALGEGALYFDYDLPSESVVGAIRGGGTFLREVEIREIPFDGAMGKTKGLRRKITANVSLTMNSLELKADLMEKFWALKSTERTGHKEVTAKEDIELADYVDNIAFVGKTQDGRAVIYIIENALGDGNMELTFVDKDEIVPQVVWSGHYSPDAHTVEPWKVLWPDDTDAYDVTFTVNDGSTAIEDATVTMNNIQRDTNASGNATITNVPVGTNIPFRVVKGGFQTYYGAADVVDQNVNLTVSLTAI